jgi:hypothetical protein
VKIIKNQITVRRSGIRKLFIKLEYLQKWIAMFSRSLKIMYLGRFKGAIKTYFLN